MDHKYIVLDIECNGFQPDKIWCVCAKDSEQKKIKVFKTDEKKQLNEWLKVRKKHLIVGHYIIDFDLPILYDLWDIKVDNNIVDTLELSKKVIGDLPGGHSLEAWGLRFAKEKGKIDDFSVYNENMIDYCKNDVEINDKLYKLLTKL